jgi:hypothetical protein
LHQRLPSDVIHDPAGRQSLSPLKKTDAGRGVAAVGLVNSMRVEVRGEKRTLNVADYPAMPPSASPGYRLSQSPLRTYALHERHHVGLRVALRSHVSPPAVPHFSASTSGARRRRLCSVTRYALGRATLEHARHHLPIACASGPRFAAGNQPGPERLAFGA